MSVPLILTFVSTVVFAIQFLIVVDLYNHISALIRDNPRAETANTSVPLKESLQDTTRLYRVRKPSSSHNDQ